MKRLLAELIRYGAGGVMALVLYGTLVDIHADRRFALYHLQRELRAGMTREEVQAAISRHDAPFVHRHRKEDGYVLRVDTGWMSSVLLSMTFKDDRLSQARIRGEDGPQEKFADAPADIPGA